MTIPSNILSKNQPALHSRLALLFGFTHYETLAAGVVVVTGRNSKGSLALRLSGS